MADERPLSILNPPDPVQGGRVRRSDVVRGGRAAEASDHFLLLAELRV